MPTRTGCPPGVARLAGGPRRRRARPTGLQVLGELQLAAGAVLLLFVTWQLWWTDFTAEESHAAVLFRDEPGRPPVSRDGALKTGLPVVDHASGYGQAVGVVRTLRLGVDDVRPVVAGPLAGIAESVSAATRS